MSFYGNTNFLVEVSKGNIPGHSIVHKFGRNDAVSTSWELVSQVSGATSFLSAATTVRVKSGGDAADDAAGAGAREVTVQGINDSFVRAEEAIATAGTGASLATATSFLRVDRAFVSAAGTYATPVNTADIVIENSGGGTDLIHITADEGQTQYGAYALATGVTAYLLSVFISVDTSKTADFRFFVRENSNDTTPPVSPKRLKLFWDGVSGSIDFAPLSPILFVNGPADIWMEAKGSGAPAEVSVDFELLLVDD